MNAKPTNNMIATVCIVVGAAMTLVIFFESRLDAGLRMAALVFASNICTAIIAISSLLLTGKDLTAHGSDLPPGSLKQTTETVQTPPLTPDVPTDPTQAVKTA